VAPPLGTLRAVSISRTKMKEHNNVLSRVFLTEFPP
jgi:hypothetical protein